MILKFERKWFRNVAKNHKKVVYELLSKLRNGRIASNSLVTSYPNVPIIIFCKNLI